MDRLKDGGRHLLAFLKWMAIAIVVGGVMGAVGTGFHIALEWAAETRGHFPWLLWLLPAGGLLIVFLYRSCGVSNPKGTNLLLETIREKDKLPRSMAPLISVATVITHLFGGSAGREGAVLQLGGGIAYEIGRVLRLDEKDLHIITMCGMSAAFSALFGTPIAAAVFSMEVISVGIMHYSALVPCVAASALANWIASSLGTHATAYAISGIPELSPVSLLQTSGFAILCAVLSIAFCVALHTAGKLFQRFFPNQYLRIAVGGGMVILFTYLFRSRDYLGAGTEIISAAAAGTALPWAFALKILFTAVTLGSGFKGGEIVPTFFIGATFGCAAGPLLGLDPSFSAAMGMIALFCGVTNCPLTSLLIGVEMFGAQGMIFYFLAVAVSYMLSGYYGLYQGQKILYSKFRPEFIDTRSH